MNKQNKIFVKIPEKKKGRERERERERAFLPIFKQCY
jgi:hypothetical protein